MATRIVFYTILIWFVLTSNHSFGQDNLVWGMPADFQQATIHKPYLYQFFSPSRSYDFSQIRKLRPDPWQAVNTVNFGGQDSPGWAMVLLTTTVERTVWLELESHFIDSVQVWLIQAPNSPQEAIRTYQPTGFRVLRNDRDAPVRHPFFLKPLHLLPNIRYALYIRGWVPPGDALKFDVKLWHPAAFGAYQQRLIVGWGIFIGLVLMSVFVTLVSYFFHPRRIYLYYCGYVLCMSIYGLLNDGWGLFLPESLRWLDSTSRVVHGLIGGICFLMLFSRRFLSIDITTGRWWLRLNPVWLALLLEAATLVVDYAIHHQRFDLTRAGYRVGFGVMALYALLWLSYVADAIRRHFRPVWLYLGSVLVWLFFYVVDIFVVNTGWLTESFPDMLVFRIALLFEIALIFIGWMYRQRIIRESEQRLQHLQQTSQQELFETERRRQAEELKALRLQNELQQQRERLARDLHDGIGSQLTHIAGRLDILSIRHPNEQPQLQRLSQFARETNQSLRDTVWILNRSEISLSTFSQRLHAYLLRLWDNIDTPRLVWSINPSVMTESSNTDPILSPLVVQCLFRITQEAVNNAFKYAEATAICVSLTNEQSTIQLIIADNGCGFDPTTVAHGYGLTNMQKRAEETGGVWTLTSHNTGTQIQITFLIANA